MNFRSANQHAPGGEINADISKIHCFCSIILVQYCRAAQAGPNAGRYFPRSERFADVIIGPSIERLDFVSFLSPGGEHNYRNLAPLAYLPNDIYPVHVWEPKVEKDEIGIPSSGLRNSILTGRGFVKPVIFSR